MIDSILIANRGEIACRIIHTCRRLGIKSIAVYSEADAHARHVKLADEAVFIGPAEASQSYLNTQAILGAAVSTGARAIHPGYGFLSEQPELPRQCEENNIIWIGPRADIIEQMGSKIAAKKIAASVDVPAVPGVNDGTLSDDDLLQQAKDIGFPVLIKASAGGGGKGMRLVQQESGFLDSLQLSRVEASRAFGDDSILVEKLITRPRHLEVQLVGDKHGSLVHLFERECSIQRNYQKLIEEAPAAFLTDATRQKIFEYALRVGRAIGYDSTGTVEFVLDESSGEVYFMEMNTRLQVEHTVTEEITGLDLVELQIRVAGGEPLGLTQTDITCTGHAIEARVNSEDPALGYLPQIGGIDAYQEPNAAGIRIDSGIQMGSEISPHYDSMLAKVIGYGRSRKTAVQRLILGLQELYIAGVGTNQAFLIDMLAREAFSAQPLTTGFIDNIYPEGWLFEPDIERVAVALGAWGLCHAGGGTTRCLQPWREADGFRVLSSKSGSAWVRLLVDAGRGSEYRVELSLDQHGTQCLIDEKHQLVLKEVVTQPGLLRAYLDDDRYYDFAMSRRPDSLTLSWRGVFFNLKARLEVDVLAESSDAASAGQNIVSAPMPGVISAVSVSVGQAIHVNDVVVALESMKLIHSLAAPVNGVIKAVHCKAGDMVTMNMPLVEIEPDPGVDA